VGGIVSAVVGGVFVIVGVLLGTGSGGRLDAYAQVGGGLFEVLLWELLHIFLPLILWMLLLMLLGFVLRFVLRFVIAPRPPSLLMVVDLR